MPEQGRIDVSFGKVAIELKTVDTNYRDGIADIKGKTITKNISSIIADIAKHRKNEFPHKFLIFVVFPLTEVHDKWKKHLARVENELGDVCTSHPFTFTKISEGSQSVSGVLYYGKVK